MLCAIQLPCFPCSAAEHIRRGDADLMLAGGSDAAIIPSGVAGFISCKALSKRNEDPTRASRPWDRQRDGFVIGEGAGVCVVTCAAVQIACSSATSPAVLAFQPGADSPKVSRSEELAALITRLLCMSIVLVCPPGTGREMAV